jgi:CheY-like chemotaxis protein
MSGISFSSNYKPSQQRKSLNILSTQEQDTLDKQKIMIIEDNKDVAGFLDLAVQALGYETIMASDGRTALKLLRHTTPAMILLDMYLPDISGAEILQHVRTTSSLQQIRVVVLTGESQTLSQEVIKQANFTLIKPVDFQTFSQLIIRIAQSQPSSNQSAPCLQVVQNVAYGDYLYE